MKDCGKGNPGKHLKQAIEYITNPEKTGQGQFVGGHNCQPEFAYEQMKETKQKFGKTDKRQGYHLIVSFTEGETTPGQAFEIIGRIVKEYLGDEYEAIYSVHNNTDHVHGHIIFNSVSLNNGKKYRYEKGDWARNIQPVTNRICEEYGLSIIEIEEDKARAAQTYKEWDDYKDGKFVWENMIKRDLDACVMQAPTFESLVELLKDKGYEIKQNKYFAIRPPGLTRFRRTKTLGEEYTEDRLRERILTQSLSDYKSVQRADQPRIVYCKVRRFRKTRLCGLQKKYFAKMYRTGKLKKRPYSQAWKYRDDIRKFEKLQQQYLFLNRYDITKIVELGTIQHNLTEKKKEVSTEKRRTYKERARFKPLFNKMQEAKDLRPAVASFLNGDDFFTDEYEKFQVIEMEIKNQGYTMEDLVEIKEQYEKNLALMSVKEKAVKRELTIANTLIREVTETKEDVLSKESKTPTIQKEEKYVR